MSAQAALAQLVDEVGGTLSAGLVDLQSGLVLAIHHREPNVSPTLTDIVAASAVEMFRGRMMTTIEKMMATQRGTPMRYHINEIQMTTDNTHHFMLIVPERPNSLLALITTRQTSLGMGWTALRNCARQIVPYCPL